MTTKNNLAKLILVSFLGLGLAKAVGEEVQAAYNTRLILNRTEFTDKSTIGELYLDKNQNGQIDTGDEFIAYTLEPADKDNQPRISCIPEGQYEVTRRNANESAKYNYDHLLVKDVPKRSYILFHRGNSPNNTTGCFLTGETKAPNFVGKSKNAHDKLMKIVNKQAILRIKDSRRK